MKKFFILMLAMLWMSVAAFSQITISQEDYDKLPGETKTQIEKLTTEKAVKGEIKEVSEYANLGKEIGVAVNETLKAVEDFEKEFKFSLQDLTNWWNKKILELE